MAVILLSLALVLHCVYAQIQFVTPDKAAWNIKGDSYYNAAQDTTIFTYTVNAFSNGKVVNFVAGIPSCPELELPYSSLVRDRTSGLRGVSFGQDVSPSRGGTYTVVVNGLVQTAEIDYVLEGLKRTSGDRRHEYSRGSVLGPKCTKVTKVTCEISQEIFKGECVGNSVRLPLVSKSKYYTELQWSTDYPGCSFTQTNTVTPSIIFHGPICDTEFRVKLEVWGSEHQHEVCYTTITATDLTPPTFSGILGSSDETVSCDDIPSARHIVAKDTCDNDVEVIFSEREQDVQYGEYSIFRTWIAIDDCDNKATYKQKVTVADKEPPTLIGVPDDDTVDCAIEVQPCVVIATDNCDDVTVEHTNKVVEGTCIDSWEIIRTWVATDSSHNSVTGSQTVTVQDLLPPTLQGRFVETTVECNEVPDNIVVTASDNCQEVVMVSSRESTTLGSCNGAYTIKRSFEAVDECGNHVSESWIIHVVDTQSPQLSDVGMSEWGTCLNIPTPCVVEATDNCDVYPMAIAPVISTETGSCLNSYVITYTWIVTDDCGNKANKTKLIHVSDSTPPKFNHKVPPFIKASCEAFPSTGVYANDDCDGSIIHDFIEITDRGSCAFSYSLYREWHASDLCGNKVSMVQTVDVSDQVPPMLVGVPPDMRIACDGPLDLSNVAVTYKDNCENICLHTVSFSTRNSTTPDNCPHTYLIINTWDFSDCCGNTVEQSNTIEVYDDAPPKLVGIPGSRYIQIQHFDDVTIPNVTAVDDCTLGAIFVAYEEYMISGTCEHNFKTVRKWNAHDECGNVAESAQTIHCDDYTPPTFANSTYEISMECPITGGFPEISILDNVRGYDIIPQEERLTLPGTCEDEYRVVRQMTATDPCGNTAQKDYTIHVYDTAPPLFETVPCLPDIYTVIDTTESYNGICVDDINASDSCAGSIDVAFQEEITQSSCSTEYTITREWRATDNCGNYITESRTIDVQDLTPPELHNVPPHTTIDCTENPAAEYQVPTASDYGWFSPLQVTRQFRVVSGQPCENNFTAIKCWVVHDCVGREVKSCQTVQVQDTIAPTLSYCPHDITVPCDNVPSAQSVTAVDNCGNAHVHYSEEREGGTCEGEYTITRTWVAIDECNHESTCTQVVSVIDIVPPSFDFTPPHEFLECGSYSRYVAATCSDNCNYRTKVVKEQNDLLIGSCDDEKVTLRMWTCEDECGNTDYADQTLTFSDTEPPRFTVYPADMSIPCDGSDVIPNAPLVRAIDDCDNRHIVVHFNETKKPGAYGYVSSTNFRYWSATDNCGNVVSMTQTIVVYDDVPPILVVPTSHALNCTAPFVIPNFTSVYDNCDPSPTVSVSSVFPYNNCHNQYTVEYTWCPFDKMGNEGQCKSMRISVDDPNPPQFLTPIGKYRKVSYSCTTPGNLSCDYGPLIGLQAEDDCDDVEVVWTQLSVTDSPCVNEKSIVYQYTATDSCGNDASLVETVYIVDNVPPPLAPLPASTTVECPTPLPNAATVVSDDSYSYEPLEVLFYETELDSSCEHNRVIERTWVVVDCAGNDNTHKQRLTVLDTTRPTLPDVIDEIFQCEPDDYVGLQAYDECDDYVDVTFTTDTFNELNCSYTKVRKWVAMDDCGNKDTQVQTLTIEDTTEPQMYGRPRDVTVDHHSIPGNYPISCTDNCDGEMGAATLNETTEAGTCDYEYIIRREWSCIDECGTSATAVQIVNVIDIWAPVFSYCPADITVQIGLLPDHPELTAIDDQVYGQVNVTYNETEFVAYHGHTQKIYTRTWSAKDECENSVLCVQLITVIDTVPPIIPDVPRDTYVDCEDPIIVNWQTSYIEVSKLLAESISDLSNVTITPWYDVDVPAMGDTKIAGTCKSEYTLTRTWTATDHAGNSLSDTQVITVIDDKPPVFDSIPPPSITVQCEFNQTLHPGPGVTDNCEYDPSLSPHVSKQSGTCESDYILFRQWIASDVCGNTKTVSQTVYVVDSNPPDMTAGDTSDVSLECSSYNSLPSPPSVSCKDDCAGVLTPSYEMTKHSHTCEDSWTMIRTWVCNDYCGHSVSETQSIFLTDTTPPDLNGIGDLNTTIVCAQSPPELDVTATDNCADYVQVHYEVRGYSLEYTENAFTQIWTAFDHCGNRVTKERVVTVSDPVDPVISPTPPSVTIDCEDYSAYEMPELKCHDNCGRSTMTRSTTVVDGTCNHQYAVVTSWVCTDVHQNVAEHNMTVTVMDLQAPVLNTYDNQITLPCDDFLPVAAVTVTDNCDYQVTVEFNENKVWPSYLANSRAEAPVLWDLEMLPTPQVRIYVIPKHYYEMLPTQDIENKNLRSKQKCIDYCVQKNQMVAAGLAGIGPCGGIQWFQSKFLSGLSGCYLYTPEQICEVQKTAYQVPGSQSVLTQGDTSTLNWAIIVDYICEVPIEPVHLCDSYFMYRVWSAVDNCGNSVAATHTIRVEDLQPPVFSNVPQDFTWSCDQETETYSSANIGVDYGESWSHGISAPNAVDQCTPNVDVVETFDYQPGNCDANSVTTFTWTATDHCGLASTASMVMTKWDIEPATFGYVLADEDFECVGELPVQPEPAYDDNCGNSTINLSEKRLHGTCVYTIAYTWTAEDPCGNSASVVKRLHVADTTPPEIQTNMTDLSINCTDWASSNFDIGNPSYLDVTDQLGSVTSYNLGRCSDECGQCHLSASILESYSTCEGDGQRVVTLTASDECGNKEEVYYTITIVNTFSPVFNFLPQDVIVPCEVNSPAPKINATHPCGPVQIKFSEVTEQYECEVGPEHFFYKVYRTWTAIDNCGQTSVANQVVTVVDIDAPVINVKPYTPTMSCESAIPQLHATATDECGLPQLTQDVVTVAGSCDDKYNVINTWTAVDRCGRVTVESATISVQDIQNPNLNHVPDDDSVECDDIPAVPTVEVNDNCAYPTTYFEEKSTREGYQCHNYTLTRTWWAVDNCGNRVEDKYQLFISDSTPPVLTCAGMSQCEPIEIECDIYPPLPPVVAYDNCYEHAEVQYTATPTFGTCPHDHSELRTWSTHDSCGHSTKLEQKVTYFDRTAPVIVGVIKDVTLECPNTAPVPQVTAYDNCDYAIKLNNSFDTIDPDFCAFISVVARTWIAEDECGNSDSVVQTVTIVDTTPPHLDLYSAHAKVQCDQVASSWPGTVTATDDCDWNVLVKFVEEKLPGSCEDNYVLIRKWSAHDCSGNYAEHFQTVRVEDTIPPYFTTPPPSDETTTLDDFYGANDNLYSAEAADNCADPFLSLETITVPLDYDCDYIYYRIRTWTISDDCGNTDVMIQTLEVVDTTAPLLDGPSNITVECDSIPEPCDVTVIGDVDYAESTLSFRETTIPGSCDQEYLLSRRWTAVDCAGNQAQHTQYVHVQDTESPVFTRYPPAVTVGCDCTEINVIADVEAVDNCDIIGDEVDYYLERDNGTCAHEYTMFHIWSSSDTCGNFVEHTQTVNVQDLEPPVFCDDFCSQDGGDYTAFQCDEVPEIPDPVPFDECDEDPYFQRHSMNGVDPDPRPGVCANKRFRYEWAATDDCGNRASCLRYVEVVDVSPPIVEDDIFCYPFNDYGPSEIGNYAIYNVDDMIDPHDNCDGWPTHVFFSCNGTNAGEASPHCYYHSPNNLLYVYLGAGIEYDVWFTVKDSCENEAELSKHIWIPLDSYSYKTSVENGDCNYGIGTSDFRTSAELPQQYHLP